LVDCTKTNAYSKQIKMADLPSDMLDSIACPINRVLPKLYIKNLLTATDLDILKAHKIIHIVSVLEVEWKIFPNEIDYYCVCIDADENQGFEQQLKSLQ